MTNGSKRLRQRVLSSVGATSAIYGIDRLLQLGFLAILGRLLTPADFGVLAAAIVFISFVQTFTDLGVGVTLTQIADLDDRTIRVGNGIVFGMAIVLFALAEAAAPLIAAWFRQPELLLPIRVAALALLIQVLIVVPQALMLRRMRARDVSAIELASGVVANLAVAVPMALLGFSYWALIAGVLTQLFMRGVLLNLAIKFPRGPAFHRSEARRLLVTSTGFSLAVLFNKIALEADNLIVGRYLSAHALGLYSRAYVLMTTPSKTYQIVVDRVFFPALAQVQHAPERLRSGYRDGLELTATGGIPIALLMIITAPELIRVVLGDQWGGAIVPLQLLSVAIYFRLAYKVSATVLRSTGRAYQFAFFQFFYATMIVISCLLAYPFGLAGIAVAVSTVLLLNWLVVTVIASRIVRLRAAELVRAHSAGLAGGLVIALATALFTFGCRAAGWSAFPTLALAVAAAGAAWASAAWLFPSAILGPAGRSILRRAV